MWPASRNELIEIQRALAGATPDPWWPPRDPPAIGAAVVVFARGQTGPGARGDPAWSAAAVLRRRQVLAEAMLAGAAAGPYAPGLLALREGPCLESCLRALAVAPDVVLVDATARDHPRRAGLALQLGAVADVPTVGVTHRPLLARGEWPDDERGAWSPLVLAGERVGVWLRTRRGARPLAVHPGWRTTLEVAIDVVLMAARAHRTPEPLRHARRLARVARADAARTVARRACDE
ncbi:MAG: endonuclease V [Solirubrobacterales bacterium]|nr:endonuclease V [Solirubrobacterales bacterium]